MQYFFINELRKTKHIYIDFLLLINKNFPACFVLLNNKNEKSYYIALNYLYNIIANNYSSKLDLISYTKDFEPGLCNSCKKIFS